MKRLLFVLCFVLFLPQIVSAEEPKETYYLFNETFDGAGISQFYKTTDGIELYNFIPIPAEWLEDVENSKDHLLKAKQLLAYAYYQNNSNERLAELFGLFVAENPTYTFTVDPSYKESYKTMTKSIVNYLFEQKEAPVVFDKEDRQFKNYTEFVPTEYTALHQFEFPTTEELIDSNKTTLIENIKQGDYLYIFGISILVVILIVVSYLFFKRR